MVSTDGRYPTMRLIDTHCHLDEESLYEDLPNVVDAAHEAGVEAIITIGTSAESSRRSVELAENYDCIFAVVGIHPNYCSEVKPGDWEVIQELSEHAKVVAVGETGLDRYWDYAPIDLQLEFFQRHLELSRNIGKPFVVHCRDADDDVRAVLREAAAEGPLNGVMHSFCQSAQSAEEYVTMGLHLSFTGMLTFGKNHSLRETAAAVPVDRIFVETDAPYLSPVPHRGKRNEPAFVSYTLRTLAEARGVEPEEMAELTTANARRFFGL
ncbi:MAG: TatD family hydrolase [Planctomycetota bacterium]|nr:TatD family hydrolase [Planctomycetota bacterium]MDA1247861.1 TatD family hydrolase [Planctomycetota bacterium]